MSVQIRETHQDKYKEAFSLTGKKFLSAIIAKRDVDDVDMLLNSNITDLSSPHIFKSMLSAASMVEDELRNRPETFIFHGDYDCDGLTSCYIFSNFVNDLLGFYPATYVNNRELEGYGITAKVVEKLYNMGYRFILTADNGITSIEAALKAKELGMKMIITDHHEPKRDEFLIQILPDVEAIVNHKVDGETQEKIDICGAGTIFFMCRAISEEKAEKYIDAAGLATVVDMVKIVDKNNRILVKESIRRINENEFSTETLRRIFQIAIKEGTKVDEDSFGFAVGPMINATGRMSKAQEFLKLYSTQAADKQELEYFYSLNTLRKELTSFYFSKIIHAATEQNKSQRFIVITGSKGIPEGLLGLIASKLESIFLKPTFVFAKDEDGNLKGSGRSNNVNLQDLFAARHAGKIKGGGHRSACGIILDSENVPYFLKTLSQMEISAPSFQVDAELKNEMFTVDLIEELSALKPFGQGLKKPSFLISVSNPESARMLQNKHLSFKENGKSFIMFNSSEKSEISEYVKSGRFIGNISINEYNGNKTPQMIIDSIDTWS